MKGWLYRLLCPCICTEYIVSVCVFGLRANDTAVPLSNISTVYFVQGQNQGRIKYRGSRGNDNKPVHWNGGGQNMEVIVKAKSYQ